MLVNVTPITHTPDKIFDAAVSIRSKLIRFWRNNDIELFQIPQNQAQGQYIYSFTHISFPLHFACTVVMIDDILNTLKKDYTNNAEKARAFMTNISVRFEALASPKQLKPTRDSTANAAALQRKPEVQIFKR